MRKFINEVKLYIKFKIKQFIETRFFLAILCLIIGATSTICFYEGKPLYNYINQGLIYTVELNRASAEEVPQGGEVVSAGSLQEVSLTIPAKGSIEELIAHFFKTDAQIAIAVAKSESNLNPLAHNENNNGTIDTGVFRLIPYMDILKNTCKTQRTTSK